MQGRSNRAKKGYQMNGEKLLQEGIKLAALLVLIALIIWTMPEQSTAVTHAP